MKVKKFSRCLSLALLSMGSLSSWALGLGEVQVQSELGQPIVADVELLSDPSEMSSLRMGLAPVSQYHIQGLDFNAALLGAKVVVKKNASGKTIAQITGNVPVTDPSIQLIVDGETGNGKVRRAYTIFIDPSRRVSTKLPGESSFLESSRPIVLPALEQVAAVKIDKPLVMPPMPGKPVSQAPILTNVVQHGQAPSKIDIVKGSGHKQKIGQALFSIVPKGWKGYATDASVKFSESVDWNGQRDWLTVLDGVVSSVNLTATVDWDKKEVTFASINAAERADEAAATQVQTSQQEKPAQVDEVVKPVVVAQAHQSRLQSDTADDLKKLQLAQAQSQAEIEDLKANLVKANAQIQESQNALAAKSDFVSVNEVTQLRVQLNAANIENQKMSEKLSKSNAAIQSLDEQIADLRTGGLTESQVSDLRAQLASAISSAERLSGELTMAQQEHAQSKKLIEDHTSRQAQMEKQIADEQAKSAALQDSLNKEISARELVQVQVKHLNEMLAATQERLSVYTSGFALKKDPVTTLSQMNHVTLIGPELMDQPKVKSSGMNVSFSSALKQIIPQGWIVTTDPSVGNALVGWSGANRAWTQVLGDVLKMHGLKGTIDSVTKEVKIGF